MTSTAKFDQWKSTAGVTRQNVIQVKEFRSVQGDKSVSSASTITIMSATITVKANSRLYVIYHTGQMQRSIAQCNPQIYFQIDGITQGNWSTNHYFYPDSGDITTTFRPVATLPWISTALSAGDHTITVLGSAYNGTITYDYQSNSEATRVSRMTVMEISG